MTLYSGAAAGADFHWNQAAAKNHRIVNYSFEGHVASCGNLKILSQQQLVAADEYVITALNALGKSFSSYTEYAKNLLRRNWYITQSSDALYAIGFFGGKHILGGTGIAVELFKKRPLYFFDELSLAWYEKEGNIFKELKDLPPTPKGNWGGVGTRDIKHGIKEIYKVVK